MSQGISFPKETRSLGFPSHPNSAACSIRASGASLGSRVGGIWVCAVTAGREIDVSIVNSGEHGRPFLTLWEFPPTRGCPQMLKVESLTLEHVPANNDEPSMLASAGS